MGTKVAIQAEEYSVSVDPIYTVIPCVDVHIRTTPAEVIARLLPQSAAVNLEMGRVNTFVSIEVARSLYEALGAMFQGLDHEAEAVAAVAADESFEAFQRAVAGPCSA